MLVVAWNYSWEHLYVASPCSLGILTTCGQIWRTSDWREGNYYFYDQAMEVRAFFYAIPLTGAVKPTWIQGESGKYIPLLDGRVIVFWKKHVGPEMMLCLFLENVHNNLYLSHTQNTLIPSHYDRRPGLLRDYEVAIILWNYIYIKIKSHQIWSIVLDVWKLNTLKRANTWMKHVGMCQCAISIPSKWGLYE